MRRPSPSEYALCDDFDVQAYKAYRTEQQAEARVRLRRCIYAIVYPTVFVGALWAFDEGGSFSPLHVSLGELFTASWIILIFGGLLAVIINESLIGSRIESLFLSDIDENADAFVEAFEAWEYSNAETGLGFWMEKRGVEFEEALIRMFAARGCAAMGTKGSGDGGVDIILKAGATFWCQCKAHAKPVSVGPIREIAGVCSLGRGRPVVFAINGYTSAARETAEELGVWLFDTPDIIRLARRDRIVRL